MNSDMHMYDWYAKFYTSTKASAAYSQYCSVVFGKDFSQHGYSSIAQIDQILKLAEIKDGITILDLGCGNGKMLEYIFDQYSITAYGVDFSADAIDQAKSRTYNKRNGLHFKEGLIGNKLFPNDTFDIILCIETIFFGESLTKTIHSLQSMLKPSGVIAATYMLRKAETDSTAESFDIYGNNLSLALRELGLVYTTTDLTEQFYQHMKTKRIAAEKLQSQFEAEDNMFLHKNIMMESIDTDMTLEEFIKAYARYCYCITEM